MELAGRLTAEEFLNGAPMTPDMVSELMRQLMKEALILSAPVLIAAMLLSFVLSLVQTLTSLQEQSLTAVPRLAAVALILLVGMPWFLERMATYTRMLLRDFHRFLG
jgi:flagellar biosynthesis protein FliQ